MALNTNWDALASERRALVEAVCSSDDAGLVWARIRSLLRGCDHADDLTVIYEGPGRAYLLPLQFELISRFVERFSEHASTFLVASLEDVDPAVVGYSLFALSLLGSSAIRSAVDHVSARTEEVHSLYGSFGWEGSLADYAKRLVEDEAPEA